MDTVGCTNYSRERVLVAGIIGNVGEDGQDVGEEGKRDGKSVR